MQSFIPRILAFVLLYAAHPCLRAQDTIRPASPEIVRVTVDTSTHLASIEWKASTSPNVEKYTMYYYFTDSEGQTYPKPTLDTVDGNTRQYIYDMLVVDPSISPQTLTLAAINSSGKISPFTEPPHSTMHLSAFYDSCDNEMELSWTPYQEWGDDLVRYDVYYYNVDLGLYIKITEIDPDSTAAYHREIEDNRMYCYYIKAIRNDDMVSFSNIACRNVSYPLHPVWINAESASAVGADQVEVKFSMDPAGEVTSYQLFKAEGPGKPFMPDEIFKDITEDSLTHLDLVFSTEKKYRYKLYSLDVCNNPFTESNICGNIVLTARSVGLEGFLSWNPYVDFEVGVKKYRIYRDINRTGPVFIGGTFPPDTTYTDDLSFVSGEDIEDEICYLVEAEENDSYTRGNQGFSRSNLSCVSVVPEILMANAFTPNDDGVNEEIKPELTFIPRQYIFQVFDRWGSRIFETRDPNTPWKGRVNGGPKAPEGVYVYYIKLTTSSGIEVEKKGVITLIYP